MSFKFIKKCRLCESNKLKKILDLQPTPVGDDYVKKNNLKHKIYPLNLMRCQNCDFVQLSVNIDPNMVYGDYLYVTNTSAGLPEHFKNLVSKLKKKKIIYLGAKILEIGCNDGTLLSFLKNKKCLVVGIDPAAKIVNKLNFKIFKDLYNSKSANKINDECGKFDVVIANNVIANIDDLKSVFRSIKKNLNKSGKFIMETFSLYGLVKNNLLDNIYHEHISYISIEPIQKFAKKIGLYLTYAEHLEVKGGSLRLIFENNPPKKYQKLAINNLIKEEKELLKKKNIFKDLQKFNQDNNKKIFNYLKNKYNEKKNIYGFGASVGTTTNIFNLRIAKYVKGIFDHEKIRHNLFLPGTRIKVLDPKKIKKINPDVLVIFAWRYAKLILKKINLPNNCEIILPLPNFKILKFK
jgi:2-polyprenyl-3-methyl-5-hydroxy-6-metoxy-1,4-benzoquinol methylase